MDGIHDVGGEQGFGRVEPTAEEPPFKQDWEARLVGIFRAITRPREADWNADKFRFKFLAHKGVTTVAGQTNLLVQIIGVMHQLNWSPRLKVHIVESPLDLVKCVVQ